MVMGQSIDKVPGGLVTVAPVNTKRVPSVTVPPLLVRIKWLAEAAGAAEIKTNAAESARAIRLHRNPSATTERCRTTLG